MKPNVDIDACVFIGEPIPFEQAKIKIYPPTFKQVKANPDFGLFVNILAMSQEDIEDLLAKEQNITKIPTPYEFLLANCYTNKEFKEKATAAFEFFTHEKANFLLQQKVIIMGDLEEEVAKVHDVAKLRFLKEEDFFDFQNIIRKVSGMPECEPYDPNEHPKIREMKRKRRERDRVKAKKKSPDDLPTRDFLEAICCMGIGITPLNIGNISYVALSRLMRRYQEKEKYGTDISALMAGAKKKDVNLKYWIHKIDD